MMNLQRFDILLMFYLGEEGRYLKSFEHKEEKNERTTFALVSMGNPC
jgi:hypothetical protein